MSERITKKDCAALWHAVADMALMDRVMQPDPSFSSEQKDASRARVKDARAALRKVQRIVKAIAPTASRAPARVLPEGEA
jgi:hypothetical protein